MLGRVWWFGILGSIWYFIFVWYLGIYSGGAVRNFRVCIGGLWTGKVRDLGSVVGFGFVF